MASVRVARRLVRRRSLSNASGCEPLRRALVPTMGAEGAAVMLLQLREAFPDLDGRWRPGARFAFRGGGGGIVAELGERPVALALRDGRRLRLVADVPIETAIVAVDVIAGRIGDDEFILTFRDADTLVGVLPDDACLELGGGDGVACIEPDEAWTSIGAGRALALRWSGPLFALAAAVDLGDATQRAQGALGDLPWQQAEQRLAEVEHVAAAPLDDD